jgi:hypothetical protein
MATGGDMGAVEFLRGEVKLGEYQVQIARPTQNGWVGGIPPLTATVTNYRLILVPQTRKPHPPASIPKLYIYRIRNVTLSQRQAVQIRLKIGYDLNLFVGWGLYNEFTHELSAMIAPPPQVAYKPVLTQEDLVRLIEQINEL